MFPPRAHVSFFSKRDFYFKSQRKAPHTQPLTSTLAQILLKCATLGYPSPAVSPPGRWDGARVEVWAALNYCSYLDIRCFSMLYEEGWKDPDLLHPLLLPNEFLVYLRG